MRGATTVDESCYDTFLISIHAPRAGRDLTLAGDAPAEAIFQSTRPVRGATTSHIQTRAKLKISIHAPRAGRD